VENSTTKFLFGLEKKECSVPIKRTTKDNLI